MAFSNKPASLDKLLKTFIKRLPQRNELKRGMVLHVWPDVVGDQVAKATLDLSFESDGRLIVKVQSDAWRHEIHMNRFSITKKLNGRVGQDTVRELIVRC